MADANMPDRIWAWAWEVDRHRGQWCDEQEIVGEGTEYLTLTGPTLTQVREALETIVAASTCASSRAQARAALSLLTSKEERGDQSSALTASTSP